MVYKIKTQTGAEYIVDLERRTLQKNNNQVPLQNGSVTILSENQVGMIRLSGDTRNIFNHQETPPSTRMDANRSEENAHKIIFISQRRQGIQTSTQIASLEEITN